MEKSTASSKNILDKKTFETPEIILKSGKEKFITNTISLQISLLDFWRWSSSDILSNSLRGKLAEFIVAIATNTDIKTPREEWAAYDLIVDNKIKIEVKSSAYLQSWHQSKLSNISFSIKPSRFWESSTNVLSDEVRRQADIYVFCVLDHKDPSTVDPLDMSQWSFYVVTTKELDKYGKESKTISLRALEGLSHKSEFAMLGKEIRAMYSTL